MSARGRRKPRLPAPTTSPTTRISLGLNGGIRETPCPVGNWSNARCGRQEQNLACGCVFRRLTFQSLQWVERHARPEPGVWLYKMFLVLTESESSSHIHTDAQRADSQGRRSFERFTFSCRISMRPHDDRITLGLNSDQALQIQQVFAPCAPDICVNRLTELRQVRRGDPQVGMKKELGDTE